MSQAPQNLQSFVTLLKNQGELQIIDAPTDPYLEIPEIHRRVIAANGPALLFTNVKNKNFPVVTNLFGTKKRVGLAFGDNAYKFISTLAKAPEEMMPPKISKLWQKREFLKSAAKVGFKKITKRSSPVLAQEIPHADMSKLPALTSWIEDGGPFLTLPLVHTKIPKELDLHAHAKENLGMYRIQIFSPNQTGLHFQIGKGGGFHLSACEQKNIPLPVNI